MQVPRPSSRGRTVSGAPNPVDRHVGERLRLRRMLLGLSQEALASCLGLTFQQIQKYERGANRIGASRLYDLARALGVTIDYFYEDMDRAVEGASPRHIARLRHDPPVADSPLPSGREALEMIRAYYQIEDPEIRRRVHDLARALSAPRAGAPPDSAGEG